MTVKVRRKMEVMGVEFKATIYLPEDTLLTKERRVKADKLDNILKSNVKKINSEYEILKGKFKNNEMEKWQWLGEKLDSIINSVGLIKTI